MPLNTRYPISLKCSFASCTTFFFASLYIPIGHEIVLRGVGVPFHLLSKLVVLSKLVILRGVKLPLMQASSQEVV